MPASRSSAPNSSPTDRAVSGYRIRILCAALRPGIARGSDDHDIAINRRIAQRSTQRSLVGRLAHRHARHHTDVDHLHAKVGHVHDRAGQRVDVTGATHILRVVPHLRISDTRTSARTAESTATSRPGRSRSAHPVRHQAAAPAGAGTTRPDRRTPRRRVRWRRVRRRRRWRWWRCDGRCRGHRHGRRRRRRRNRCRRRRGFRRRCGRRPPRLTVSGRTRGAPPISDATTVPCASQSDSPSP